MSGRQLAARNELVNWQVAPADYEIVNYDEPKWRYREYVEKFVHSLPLRSLKRKTFITISTNVLCADLQTKGDQLDPIERDIYLPLEISLTKWSMSEANTLAENRNMTTKLWMINPGKPTACSVNYSNDQIKLHKIDFNKVQANDSYFETDIKKVVNEVNAMLTPDRTVFSIQLRNCRQDLGCLKWLNKETGCKTKPIKVYSLEDLYVVAIRHMISEDFRSNIGQGLARFRMDKINSYDNELLCNYHRDILKADPEAFSPHCARALSISYTNSLLDDVKYFSDLFSRKETKEAEPKSESGY